MKLYLINDNSELITYNKVRYEIKEYDEDLVKVILKEASKYHIKEEYDYYYTDFNDSDQSHRITYKEIEDDMVVVKDNKFYGVYLKGNSMYEHFEVIITLDNKETKVKDGSDYSYTTWIWDLIKK